MSSDVGTLTAAYDQAERCVVLSLTPPDGHQVEALVLRGAEGWQFADGTGSLPPRCAVQRIPLNGPDGMTIYDRYAPQDRASTYRAVFYHTEGDSLVSTDGSTAPVTVPPQ